MMITFKGKIDSEWADGKERVKVPALSRSHCDMSAMRAHKAMGSFANSDLLPSVLARFKRSVFGESSWLILSEVPDGVTVVMPKSGFMATVTVMVPEDWNWKTPS